MSLAVDNTGKSLARVVVDGGVLVYRIEDLGMKLIGFEDVTDLNELRDSVQFRGHDRGAVYHLPILDGGGSSA